MGLGPRVIDWVVVSCGGDEEARYGVRRFTFSAPEVQRTIRMTCGLGPPCHRLGCPGTRQARFSVAVEERAEGFS
jgi:hypothetical protein